ncbi:hypothetical protein [Yinghuangia seranimata]|uniref:hypothetical protein n=1 Tax=Yinghuangia seranimata TaxID=408067 RepID=UPI00248ADDBF|nr:hypothetical protein [Yinghuangia seranimata]MDI2131819.1 hypothetical protein [Yinghuangia seranimata]
MAADAGGALLDRIVYRWQERDLLGRRGLGPAATTLPADRLPQWADGLAEYVGMDVDVETGPYTSVCWARTAAGPALIHREFALHGRDNTPGNVAHALLDPGRALGPHVVLALGMFDWATDGPALADPESGPGLERIAAGRLVAVAHERADAMRAAARDRRAVLEQVTAALLARPRAGLSLLRADAGPDPAPLLWGVFDLVSHLVRGSWSFSTYETADDANRPRFVVVPRWPDGRATRGRVRLGAAELDTGACAEAARLLVDFYVERPWDQTRQLLRGLRTIAELGPDAKADAIKDAIAGAPPAPAGAGVPVNLRKDPRRTHEAHAAQAAVRAAAGRLGGETPSDWDELVRGDGQPAAGTEQFADGGARPAASVAPVAAVAPPRVERPQGRGAGQPDQRFLDAEGVANAPAAQGGGAAGENDGVGRRAGVAAESGRPVAAGAAVAPPRVERPRGPAPVQPETRYLPVALPVPERARGGGESVPPMAARPAAPPAAPGAFGAAPPAPPVPPPSAPPAPPVQFGAAPPPAVAEPAPRDWNHAAWAADGVDEHSFRSLADAARVLSGGAAGADDEVRRLVSQASLVAVAVALERAEEPLLPALLGRLGELVVAAVGGASALPSPRDQAYLERALAALDGPLRTLDRSGVARHQIASIIGQFAAFVLDGCQTGNTAEQLALVVRNLDTVPGTYRPYQQELIRAVVAHGLGARFYEEIGRLWAASRSLLPTPADSI